MFKFLVVLFFSIILMTCGDNNTQTEKEFFLFNLKARTVSSEGSAFETRLFLEEKPVYFFSFLLYNFVSLNGEIRNLTSTPVENITYKWLINDKEIKKGLIKKLPGNSSVIIKFNKFQPGYQTIKLDLNEGELFKQIELFSSKNGQKVFETNDGEADLFSAAPGNNLEEKDIYSDDNQITSDFLMKRGVYEVNDLNNNGVFIIKKDNIVFDCNNSVLIGKNFSGIGIFNDGHDSVIIKNCTFKNFYQGIYFKNSTGHYIYNNVVSDNYKRIDNGDVSDFLNVWNCPPSQKEGGGGIFLENVTYSLLKGNFTENEQTGIGLYFSDNNTLENNDSSDNHGWGFHLCKSSFNELDNNRADNIYNSTSKYCHEVQNDGCDTAAILMIKGTNNNRITNNSFKNSGDGVFLAARQSNILHGADNNYFYNNDGSFAKHLSFEATFAKGNIFEHNIAMNAGRAAFWLGYSSENRVENNYIHNAGWDGINIDHGEDILIKDNYIGKSSQHGIKIWNSEGFSDLYKVSNNYIIEGNTIVDNRYNGINIESGNSFTISGNCFEKNVRNLNSVASSNIDFKEDNYTSDCQRFTSEEFFLTNP